MTVILLPGSAKPMQRHDDTLAAARCFVIEVSG